MQNNHLRSEAPDHHNNRNPISHGYGFLKFIYILVYPALQTINNTLPHTHVEIIQNQT